MSKKLPVASHLSDLEYKLLLQVYADHNSSMGLIERTDHTLSDIVKVTSDLKKKALKVYYRNGNWWHYSINGTWY